VEKRIFNDSSRLSEHGEIVTGYVNREVHNMFKNVEIDSLSSAELRTLESCLKSMIADIFCEKIVEKLNEGK